MSASRATRSVPESGPAAADDRALRGPILVATDGTDDSLPALHMARLLADRGAVLDVIAVIEPLVLPLAEVEVDWAAIDMARRDQLQQQVEQQLATVQGGVSPASVETVLGLPVSEISGMARRKHAAMVITGLRRHGPLQRVFLRGETPLRIARAAQRPVLVVPKVVEQLPAVAIVMTALDEASINAARLARPLLAAAKAVHVVHVRGVTTMFAGATGAPWERAYADATTAHFARLVDALGLPAEVQVETRTLTGHAVDEILEHADFVGAELIVSGYHKRVMMDRVIGPRSVAERVYRGTQCAMLLVPELAGPVTAAGPRTEVYASADEWAEPVVAFSRRNAGRVARLEVDTEVMGTQQSVAGTPLRAVDFERGANALHVIFATPGREASHFVHTIEGPTSVAVYRDDDGTDVALRVMHEGGYTLLTLGAAPV